jgi:hypothetical protein
MLRRLIVLAIIVVVLVAGISLFTYFAIYPGDEVYSTGLGIASLGRVSSPHTLGISTGLDSKNANRLQISVNTIQSNRVYVLNSTQASQYVLEIEGKSGVISCGNGEGFGLSPTSYPSSYVYSSSPNKNQSAYIAVQEQTDYCIIVFSLPNATELNFTSTRIIGYAVLI